MGRMKKCASSAGNNLLGPILRFVSAIVMKVSGQKHLNGFPFEDLLLHKVKISIIHIEVVLLVLSLIEPRRFRIAQDYAVPIRDLFGDQLEIFYLWAIDV